MAKNYFIQKAIKHPGALTRKAKRAGESPMAFARSHASAPGTTGKQARLAITLSKFHKKSAHGSGQFSKADIAKGYMTVAMPAHVAALDGLDSNTASSAKQQSVKGQRGGAIPSEAKQVAGNSGMSGSYSR